MDREARQQGGAAGRAEAQAVGRRDASGGYLTSPRRRILVVEDNSLNLELATDVLQSAGFAVLQASTAEDGIALARAEAPDLILLDIRLPGMDGHTAVGVLKNDPVTRRTPVIALTAQAMKGDDAAALRAGFDGYIAKPIDTRRLAGTVEEYLVRGSGT